MDINVNVNVKFEETPALINCFSAFSTALQATVGALAVATTTTHTATEDNASAKGSRKNSKAAKAIPAAEAVTESVPAVQDEGVFSPAVTAEQTAAAAPAPDKEVEKALTMDEVKAACMDFIKKNPDKKAKLAECFQKVGGTKLSDTPAEKYAELIELVKGL
ncbi:hypothetical protein [Phascolarctobacterium faecium]|uniref:hypothetical protein n=1 Tax=Phascolarctobacterium faecium TaxID=33025 RepID=UPI003AB253C0